MTYETTAGREPIQIIEIDQPLCVNTYGSAPCTAAIGVTGSDKCFNARFNCQDPDNYNQTSSIKTLRFARPRANMPDDEYLIPSLVSVSTSPTVLNHGTNAKDQKALGVRATMTATFADHPHTDRVVDPYVADRSYDPIERSTFWAKWLRRNPFYEGYVIRVLDGYVGQTLAQMTSRTYLIEDITGPDGSGRVTIRAKDVLTLADNKNALAPAASTGELIEVEPVGSGTLRVTGAVAADYPAPGLVRISDNLITYTGVSTISGTEINLTGCTGGQYGTEDEEHDAGDRVQLCLQYTTENVVDIIYDLLTTYAGVDTSYINLTEWNQERDDWLSLLDMSAIITEPTGVTKLLGELTEQGVINIWWDERQSEIKLRAVRAPTDPPVKLNDDQNLIADSVQTSRQPKERASQIWVFYLQRNPTEDLNEEKNYSQILVQADLEKESADQYGKPAIKRIYSRWIASNGQAVNAATRLLARLKRTPEYMNIALDAKDRSIWTGDVVDITNRNIVNEFGEEIPQRYLVISADEAQSGHMVRYKLVRFDLDGRFSFVMASGQVDYTLATDEQKDSGCFIGDSDGLMSDGTEGYLIQ